LRSLFVIVFLLLTEFPRLKQRGRGFNIDYLQIRKSRASSVKKTDALGRNFCGEKSEIR